jgi:hypothetical protein
MCVLPAGRSVCVVGMRGWRLWRIGRFERGDRVLREQGISFHTIIEGTFLEENI